MHPKHADTDYDVLDLVQQRWSPRALSPDPIDDADLFSLFEAARWSSSCRNDQPWIFSYAHNADQAEFQKFHDVLKEGNQNWAQHASVLVLGAVEKISPKTQELNDYAWFDLGQAVAQLTLEALSRDIYIHQMAGFYPSKARELLEIPDHIEPVVMLALGGLGDSSQLQEDWQIEAESAARIRKPQEKFVFKGSLKKA